MRTLNKVVLFLGAFLILITLSGYVYLYVLPKGPAVTERAPIENGTDSFVMYAYKNSHRKSIWVLTYKPERWQDNNQLVFVMHGGGRNADDYLEAWKDIAEENNLLIVAPEFENKFARYTTNDYQEGNLFTFFGSRNPEEEWAYTVVENIFDHLKEVNQLSNASYNLFGHSAGGQFVHRMILLKPEARINFAVAANAGFYSFPDESLPYPYGIKDAGKEVDLEKAYQQKLIVLLGELDNDPALGTFRQTKRAMEQGPHRLARGSQFFQAAKMHATDSGYAFRWQIDTVSQVGHNYREMSKAASIYLAQ